MAIVMVIGVNRDDNSAVAMFDLDLYFMVHRLCKFVWHNIAFGGILVS